MTKQYQPYPRLEAKYLPEFKKRNKRYLVSQTYPRGQVRRFGEEKMPIVFTLYDDLGYARIHLNAVRQDKYAAIIDLENEVHINKITSMMEPDSKYDVYISMVWNNQENQNYIQKYFSKNIDRFIRSKQWYVKRSDEVETEFKIIFGEPYLVIKWKDNSAQVKFDEIEKA